MDISFVLRRAKKSIAGFTILALLTTFVSFAGVALAGDYDGHWAEDDIADLMDQGVVDTTDDFRPDESVIRAEVAKMVVLAYLGEDAVSSDYNDGSMTDIADDAWYADYMYTAVHFGIMSGDTDAEGDSTGTIRPADNVNRAEFAKMVVEAAGLTSDELGSDQFNDVFSSDWFDGYVGTAYHWSVVNGKSSSTYAPADNATRAEASAMVVRGQDPEERTVDLDGDLEIEVSKDTPEGETLPAGATSVELASWDFTADDEVEVNALTLSQFGVASLPTDHQIYLYEGAERLTNGKSINTTTNSVTFSSLDWEIDDETRTLTARMDVGTVSATGEIGIEIESMDSVTTTAAEVDADFPLQGEKFDLSTTSAGTVIIAKNGNVTNPKIGEDDTTVAKFKLTTSGEAGIVEEVGLYLTGSVATDDVEGWELYVSGTDELLASVDNVDGNDVVRFVLEDDYLIEKGSTKSFVVKADYNPGRTDDTVKIYLDESTDLRVRGDKYGYGMAVTRTAYDGDSCTTTAGDCSYSALEGGDITITSNAPVAGDIAVNGDDEVLMLFDIVSVAEVTFKDMVVSLLASESSDTDEGLLNDSDSDSANFTDVKISMVNEDGSLGETLMGPVDVDAFVTTGGGGTTIGTTAITETTTTDASLAYYRFTDEFELTDGEELSLALSVDPKNDADLDDMTLDANLEIGGTYPTLRDGNNKALTNSSVLVPSTDLSANQMTVKSPSLTFGGPVVVNSDTVVKGTDDQRFACFSVKAGTASDIELDDLTLTTSYSEDGDDGSFETDGADATYNANVVVGAVWLEDGDGEALVGSKGLADAGTVAFTDINKTYEAGVTETLCVVGDISTNGYTGSNNDSIAFGINAVGDVSATDEDGSTLAAASVLGLSSALNVSATAPTVLITVSNGGTLTASVPDSTDENIIVAGTEMVEISKFDFDATDEDFVIEKLALLNRYDSNDTHDTTLVPGGYDDNTTAVYIEYTDEDGATQLASSVLNGKSNATFESLSIFVPKDDDTTITVYADTQTVPLGADAATFVDLNLAMNNFRAIAQGSQTAYEAEKMDDSDADGEWSDELLVLTDLDDSDFVNTLAYTNDATDLVGTATLGASSSFTIDNNTADQADLPVGAFLCMTGAGGDTSCDSSTDDIYVVTAWVDGATEDTVTAILINNSLGGTYEALDEVLYAIPGMHSLTGSNQHVVYESKPTISVNAGSPSGAQTVSSSDDIFKFDIEADEEESVKFRTAKELTTCLAGNSTVTLENAAYTTAPDTVDGSSCNVDAVAGADDFVAYSAPLLEDYSYASFWIKFQDSAASDTTSLLASEIEIGCNTDNTGAVEHVQALSTSNLLHATDALIESTWHFAYDVAMPSDCTTTDEFFNIQFAGADDAGPDAADDDIFLDRVILYNNRIGIDLESDADLDSDIDEDGNHEDEVPTIAYLKEGGATVATGYFTPGANVAALGSDAGDTSTGLIHFYPINGTNSEIEIGNGDSKTFTVNLNSSTLLDEDTAADDNITVSVDYGSSSAGSVTAGDIWWYDTNANVQWLGFQEDAKLSGSTLIY
jgi:hypothetical protein